MWYPVKNLWIKSIGTTNINPIQLGWDLGEVSPPIKSYIDTLEDKNIRILIPGCGNTYEAEYLLEQGFTKLP